MHLVPVSQTVKAATHNMILRSLATILYLTLTQALPELITRTVTRSSFKFEKRRGREEKERRGKKIILCVSSFMCLSVSSRDYGNKS